MHAVADGLVEPAQVGQGDLGLAAEDLADVVEAGHGADVPLFDVADAFGVFQERSGHQRDVAEGRAAEIGDDCLVGLAVQPIRLRGEVLQVLVAHRAELFQVVLRIEAILVDRLLANNRIEIVPALGHPAAGRRRTVALGIHEDVAVGLGLGVKIAGDEHRSAVEQRPWLPIRIFISEHVFPPPDADRVDAEGFHQVWTDLP